MASFGVPMKKIGPCGGNGGAPRDMNVDGITRIVKISIRHGDSIHALRVYFLRNGCEESTEQWGGQGGCSTEFELQPTEYITSVRGHLGVLWGNFALMSLTFETNLKTYGPYGQQVGTPFELAAMNGQIVGFHGRSGRRIDALGLYVKVNNTTNGTGSCGSTCSCGSTGRDDTGNTSGSTGTGGTGNAGGSTGTGSTGIWTESTDDFWDGPVSGA